MSQRPDHTGRKALATKKKGPADFDALARNVNLCFKFQTSHSSLVKEPVLHYHGGGIICGFGSQPEKRSEAISCICHNNKTEPYWPHVSRFSSNFGLHAEDCVFSCLNSLRQSGFKCQNEVFNFCITKSVLTTTYKMVTSFKGV